MKSDINTIKTLLLFEDLDQDELTTVAAVTTPMFVTEGEILTRREDSAHTFFIVLEGNFLISFKEDRGVTLHKRGGIIGSATVIPPFKYSGTAVALTDGKVLSITAQKFKVLLEDNPSINDKIMTQMNAIIAGRMPYVEGTGKDD